MTTVRTLFIRLFLPVLFFTAIVSCDSRDDEFSNEQYVGAWDWVATTGVNVNENPTNTGKTAQLILTPEGTYTIKENDIVQSQGNYSLFKGVTSTDHVEKMYIDFSNDPDKMVNSVNATDLSLGDDSVNGLTYHYKK